MTAMINMVHDFPSTELLRSQQDKTADDGQVAGGNTAKNESGGLDAHNCSARKSSPSSDRRDVQNA